MINPKTGQILRGFIRAFCHIPHYNNLKSIRLFFVNLGPKVKVFILMYEQLEVQKKVGGSDFLNQIFFFAKTALKVFPQWSKSPIVSSVFFPLLSGLPAIFQVFLGLATSIPHFGHLAIELPVYKVTDG